MWPLEKACKNHSSGVHPPEGSVLARKEGAGELSMHHQVSVFKGPGVSVGLQDNLHTLRLILYTHARSLAYTHSHSHIDPLSSLSLSHTRAHLCMLYVLMHVRRACANHVKGIWGEYVGGGGWGGGGCCRDLHTATAQSLHHQLNK